MDGRAESEFHALPLQLPGDVARIGNGAGQAIQFRHDQRVALAEDGKRLSEAGTVPAGPGQPMVRVDPVLGANSREVTRGIQNPVESRTTVDSPHSHPIERARNGPIG